MTEPLRVSAYALEYLIDLDGNWALAKNYRAQITLDYYSKEFYGVFRWMSTLSNNRTYATLNKQSNGAVEVVELTDNGITYTGLNIGTFYTGILDKDFTKFYLESAGGWGVGATPALKTQTVSSFSSGVPVYSAASTICELDPLTASRS